MVIKYTGALIKVCNAAETKKLLLLGHSAVVFNQEIVQDLVSPEHREIAVSYEGENHLLKTYAHVGHWLLNISYKVRDRQIFIQHLVE